MKQKGGEHCAVAEFPCEYRVSVSDDGEVFRRVAVGAFRLFGAEETVRFEKTKVRFIRLEILSTTGKAWGEEETAESKLTVGEITLWN